MTSAQLQAPKIHVKTAFFPWNFQFYFSSFRVYTKNTKNNTINFNVRRRQYPDKMLPGCPWRSSKFTVKKPRFFTQNVYVSPSCRKGFGSPFWAARGLDSAAAAPDLPVRALQAATCREKRILYFSSAGEHKRPTKTCRRTLWLRSSVTTFSRIA